MWKNDLRTVIQTWLFGKYFLKNGWSEIGTVRTQSTVCIANFNSWVFKQKSEFQKTCIHHHVHNSFLIPKDFPDEVNGDINECDFFLGGGGRWILYNEH